LSSKNYIRKLKKLVTRVTNVREPDNLKVSYLEGYENWKNLAI